MGTCWGLEFSIWRLKTSSGEKSQFWTLLHFIHMEMTDFPTLSCTSTNEIPLPTLSYTCSLKKVPLCSGGAKQHQPENGQ